MKILALKLIEAGAPLYGIGIQSHIEHDGPSIHLMKVDLGIVQFNKTSKNFTIPGMCCLTWFYRADWMLSQKPACQSGSQN